MAKLDMPGPRWLQGMVGILLIALIYVVKTGITVDVEYRWALVQSIQPIAGQASYHRAVVIDLTDRQRVVRTSDILLQFQSGDYVCTAMHKRFGRRWITYSLNLPGYCRSKPHPEHGQAALEVEAMPSTYMQNTKHGPTSVPYPAALRLP